MISCSSLFLYIRKGLYEWSGEVKFTIILDSKCEIDFTDRSKTFDVALVAVIESETIMEQKRGQQMPKSFDELIRTSEVPVLVDFWAAWCGPCTMVSPIVEQLAREYTGRLVTIKVNVDKKPHIASQYSVQGIPTIMLFWKGKPIMRTTGAQSREQLKQQIENALSNI